MKINKLTPKHQALLAAGIEKLNLPLDAEQDRLMLAYLNLVIEWNKKFNLTAVVDYEEAIEKHLLDSLALLRVRDLKELHMADIGSGAGFPGIPLSLCSGIKKMDLIESSQKKCWFLREICQQLLLDKVEVINTRVEELGRDSRYRGQYDMVVSRAVTNLSVLCEYGLPLLAVNGELIAYKGPNVDFEIENAQTAIELLGGRLGEVYRFDLPGSSRRTIVVIEKISETAAKYPRRPGLPNKRPL